MSDFMNITLSADADTIRSARQYAEKHNTSLNNIIRDYLKRLCTVSSGRQAAEEFIRNAQQYPGCSEVGYHFDRNTIHRSELMVADTEPQYG